MFIIPPGGVPDADVLEHTDDPRDIIEGVRDGSLNSAANTLVAGQGREQESVERCQLSNHSGKAPVLLDAFQDGSAIGRVESPRPQGDLFPSGKSLGIVEMVHA